MYVPGFINPSYYMLSTCLVLMEVAVSGESNLQMVPATDRTTDDTHYLETTYRPSLASITRGPKKTIGVSVLADDKPIFRESQHLPHLQKQTFETATEKATAFDQTTASPANKFDLRSYRGPNRTRKNAGRGPPSVASPETSTSDLISDVNTTDSGHQDNTRSVNGRRDEQTGSSTTAEDVKDNVDDLEITKRLNRPQWVAKEENHLQLLLKTKREEMESLDKNSNKSTESSGKDGDATNAPSSSSTEGDNAPQESMSILKKRRPIPKREPKLRLLVPRRAKKVGGKKTRARKNKNRRIKTAKKAKRPSKEIPPQKERELRENEEKPGESPKWEDPDFSDPPVSLEDDCPSCGRDDLTEEGIRNLREKMFIDTLAQKLRMDPSAMFEGGGERGSSPPPLPDSVIEQMLKDSSRRQYEEEDTFYAREKQVIIPGRDMGRDCISAHATGCYHFDLKGKVKTEIASAQLWWYKTRDRHDISGQTFVVYELERSRDLHLRRRNLVLRNDTHLKEGWLSEDVTRAVRRWVDKGRTEEMLAIRCKYCFTRYYKSIYGSKHGYQPLLAIQLNDNVYANRRRRSTGDNCDPAVECCKRGLTINFRRLGIRYIYAPEVLNISYCYGYCDRVNQHTYNYTQITQRMRYGSDTVSPVMREQLKPCCAPTNLLDTYILTYAASHRNITFQQTLLPKVIVGSCGCV